ncbi:hypothetical protein LCGC14_0113160 [marine sediment metagenome]|uniref:Uncharacterized protein n=1 Tax=marine sediment metagenome TaxID=412755 RepID=A0A0F9V9W5_9ZZZZ
MPNFEFTQDKSARSCRCGAQAFTANAWNAMTDAQRAAAESQPCRTCAHDQAQR